MVPPPVLPTSAVDDKLNNIIKSLERLNQLDTINVNLQTLTSKIDSIGTRVADLEEKIGGLNGVRTQVNVLQRDVDNMVQYSRINNLVISGIPDLEAIEPKQAVIDMAHYLGVAIELVNIDTAHRLPTKIQGKDKPILVKFVDRWCKEAIMDRIAEMNRAKDYVDTKKLGYTCPQQAVFVNHHLSPKMQEIHRRGRELKKEGNISNVYVRKGRVLIKINSQDQEKKYINHITDYNHIV